jgi:hypothetical protein
VITNLAATSRVVASLPFAAIATDDTTDGTGVAWGECRSAMAVIVAGTITDGNFAFELQDSDDNSSYTAVANAFLDGTEPTLDSGDSDTVTVIGYKGTRKYLRVSVTTTATTTGGLVGALIVYSGAHRAPVAR